MDNNFDIFMNNLVNYCEGVTGNFFCEAFNQIYPFTTENISGYIDEFDLKDKSLLTVGSSCDQIINAILYGCTDITLLDINPYVKYYYYLKVACMLNLDEDEFLKFFRYKDYPKVFEDNENAFDINVYNRIKGTLRLLDYESYLMWDELFNSMNPHKIRIRLFYMDENRTDVIVKCNKYLSSSDLYNKVKKIITKVKVKFICGDVTNVKLDRKYYNIWLSNIACYQNTNGIKKMTDNMMKYLDDNGRLLLSYLYKTTPDTPYRLGWQDIYDLDKIRETLSEYKISMHTFISVDGFKFKVNSIKDSIFVCENSF